MSFLRWDIVSGTVTNGDKAGSWDELCRRYEVKRINHEEAYSYDGAYTNAAEGFFSRMRRVEIGDHHQIAGAYLLLYARPANSTWAFAIA